jgi:hypothetical protein
MRSPHRYPTKLLRFLQYAFWPVVFVSWVPFATLDALLVWSIWSASSESVLEELAFPRLWQPLVIAFLILAVISAFSRPRPILSLLASLPIFHIAVIGHLAAPSATNHKLFIASFLISLVALSFEKLPKTLFWWIWIVMVYDWVVHRQTDFLADNNFDLTFFGKIFENYVPSFFGLLLLALLVTLARAINLAIAQNWVEFKGDKSQGIDRPRFSSWGKTAILLWLPVALIFAAMSTVYSAVNSRIIQPCTVALIQDWETATHNANLLNFDAAANALTFVSGTSKPQLDAALIEKFRALTTPMSPVNDCIPSSVFIAQLSFVNPADQSTISLPIVVDYSPTVDEALENLIGKTKLVSDLQIEAAKTNFNIASQLAGATTKSSIEASLNSLPGRLPGTETSKCKWYDVACLLVNGVKSTANSVYVKQRDRAKSRFMADAEEIERSAQERGVTVAETASGELVAVGDDVSRSVVTAVRKTALGLHLLGLTLSIYSAMVLGKTFLVVAARVIYNSRTVPPLVDRDEHVLGEVKSHGSVVTVKPGNADSFFVRRGAIGLNVVERIRLPQWHHSVLSRLWNGCYFLCYIDGPGQIEACDFRVDAPGELVVWDLKEGEEVIFSFGDFVGMTSSIRLRKYVSLRLGSIVLGRVIYHCARGPGKIILRTGSTAIVGGKSADEGALHSGGLVGWSVDNEFFVKSSLTRVDVFFSGCNLRRAPGNLVVYDTSQTRRAVGGLRGIWKMVTTFLLPI